MRRRRLHSSRTSSLDLRFCSSSPAGARRRGFETLARQRSSGATSDTHGCGAARFRATRYGARDNAFNGEIAWVRIELGDDEHDHLISAEDRLNLAVGRH
jgi:hypothetical protein